MGTASDSRDDQRTRGADEHALPRRARDSRRAVPASAARPIDMIILKRAGTQAVESSTKR